MTPFRSLLFTGSMISGLLFGTPEEVAAKCGTTPTMRGTALVIDGRVVTQVDPTEDLFDQTPIWDRFALHSAEAANLNADEVVFINLGCLTVPNPTTGGLGTQEAIMVITVNALKESLSRLSALQESYFASTGHYAAKYAELPSLPLLHGVQGGTLRSTTTGWASTFRHESNNLVVCHLAVGDSELLIPNQTLGQIYCLDTRP